MSVKRKTKVELLEFRGERIEDFDDAMIDEALHVFKNQYELASMLAKKALEYVKYNYSGTEVDVSEYKLPITKVLINIKKDSLYPAVSATIRPIESDGTITITINTYPQILTFYSEDELENELKNVIAHELEHAYAVLNTYKNTGQPCSLSVNTLYRDVLSIINNSTDADDVYNVAYATYCVLGDEISAFVSQCHGEVYDFLKGLSNITNSSVRKALRNSEVYGTFRSNVRNVNSILACSDQNKINFINRFNDSLQYNENKLKDINSLDKLLKFVLERNQLAIKHCHRTAMQAYYNLTNSQS